MHSADLDLAHDSEEHERDHDLEHGRSDEDEEEVIDYHDETDDTSIGPSLEERSEDLGSPGSLEGICNDDRKLALPKDYPEVSVGSSLRLALKRGQTTGNSISPLCAANLESLMRELAGSIPANVSEHQSFDKTKYVHHKSFRFKQTKAGG